MSKKTLVTILLTLCVILTYPITATDSLLANGNSSTGISFTKDELEWINAYKDKGLNVGFDPYSGMDYFENNGKLHGFLIEIVDISRKRPDWS